MSFGHSIAVKKPSKKNLEGSAHTIRFKPTAYKAVIFKSSRKGQREKSPG